MGIEFFLEPFQAVACRKRRVNYVHVEEKNWLNFGNVGESVREYISCTIIIAFILQNHL